MFKVGDPVIHPHIGAGIVLDIKYMPGFKRNQRYYKIKIVGRGEKTMLMIPLKQAEEIGLRATMSEQDLIQVQQILSGQPLGLPSDHKKRYQILEDKLNTGKIGSIAEILHDLAWRRLQFQRLNGSTEHIYKKVCQLLTAEMAVVQGMMVKQANREII